MGYLCSFASLRQFLWVYSWFSFSPLSKFLMGKPWYCVSWSCSHICFIPFSSSLSSSLMAWKNASAIWCSFLLVLPLFGFAYLMIRLTTSVLPSGCAISAVSWTFHISFNPPSSCPLSKNSKRFAHSAGPGKWLRSFRALESREQCWEVEQFLEALFDQFFGRLLPEGVPKEL